MSEPAKIKAENYIIKNHKAQIVMAVTNQPMMDYQGMVDTVCSSSTPLETALLNAERIAAENKDSTHVFLVIAHFAIDTDGFLRGYNYSGELVNEPKKVEITPKPPPLVEPRHWWQRPLFKTVP